MTWFLIGLLAFPVQGPAAQPPGKVPVLGDMPVLSHLFGGATGVAPKSVEEAVNLALAHHPDLKLAEAELRVAEAKLVQARMQITKKTTEDYHKLAQSQKVLKEMEDKVQIARKQHEAGVAPVGVLKEAQFQLSTAKGQVAQIETEFKLAVNPTTQKCSACHTGVNESHLQTFHNPRSLYWQLGEKIDPRGIVAVEPSARSSTVDTITQHLDKRVKLNKQTNITIEEAFAVLAKEAGITLRVKLPGTENKDLYRDFAKISLPADEMPLRTWLQLIVDEYNTQIAVIASSIRKEVAKRHDLYVREYGLLLTSYDLAPSDAITLQQMMQQLKATKK